MFAGASSRHKLLHFFYRMKQHSRKARETGAGNPTEPVSGIMMTAVEAYYLGVIDDYPSFHGGTLLLVIFCGPSSLQGGFWRYLPHTWPLNELYL